MTVGFVMLAHAALHRSADVALNIASTGAPVEIHIDRRVGAPFDAFSRRVAQIDNVTLSDRLTCEWGTWTLVDASRTAAMSLLRRYPELSHIFLISGACLPIKPISELNAFLRQHSDTDFIESVTIGEVPWTKGGLSDERFTLTFPFAWRRQRRMFDAWVEVQRMLRVSRRLPEGLDPHMGSQWWCLTRATLERAFNDPRRPEFDRYFKRVWIPDESYFQSLVRYYGTNVESRSLTLSKFDFQGKPHVFYDDHLALLRQSPAFFARKIWPGSDRLYKTFLRGKTPPASIARVSPAHIDRTFVQASTRRTRGRPGMVMASRFPGKDFEQAQTAAPYAVFHGFSDIFHDFADWVRLNTGSRAHGHLFSDKTVAYFGGQTGFAGALSDSTALRDYNPPQFLRNLIWNTRGEHQSFLFSPRDAQGVCEFLCSDRNANVSVVTGAWVLPLMRSGQSIHATRGEAAELQKRESEFIALLNERRARARAQIWSLAEFLERPLDPLQAIVDGLSGAESHLLTELPRLKPLEGLPTFLQALRNAGMNAHTAGEISETLVKPIIHTSVSRFGS